MMTYAQPKRGAAVSDPFQAWIGVKASVIFAGLVGGIVSAVTGTGPWWQRSLSIVVGCLTSMYLTPLAMDLLDNWFSVTDIQLEHAAAFLCGALGMSIVTASAEIARTRLRKVNDVFEKHRPRA